MNQVNNFKKLMAISSQYSDATDQLLKCVYEHRYAALLGPRYSGKTDILDHIFENVSKEQRYICIKINLYELTVATSTLFLAQLIHRISGVLSDQQRHQLNIEFPEEPNSADFRAFVQEILSQLKTDLVLILDHLEALPRDITYVLLTSLRAQYMEQQSQPFHLNVIVSGALSLATQTTGEASPFHNIVTRVVLKDLSRAESETLLNHELSNHNAIISPKARNLFLALTQGDPFLIQDLLQKCVSRNGSQLLLHIHTGKVEKVVEEFLSGESNNYPPLLEAINLVEDDPDLLQAILMLLEQGAAPRAHLPVLRFPDIDPLDLTSLVRILDDNQYTIRNEICRRILLEKFNPGHVGNLFMAHGRWDMAIHYLGKSIRLQDYRYQTSLLDATLNAIYAADNVGHAAYYLLNGLDIGFGIEQAKVWLKVYERDVLRQIEEMGFDKQIIAQEISIRQDNLEGRVFREQIAYRDQAEGKRIIFPLIAARKQPIGLVSLYNYPTIDRDVEIQLYGYLNRVARALNEVDIRQRQTQQIQNQDEQLQRKTDLMYLLYRVSTLIQTMVDINKVLHLLLTAITAHFGLRFNRAWIFTANATRTYLDGRSAIGEFTEKDAYHAWERFANRTFDEHIGSLQKLDYLEPSKIDIINSNIHIPILPSLKDVFSTVFENHRTIRWSHLSNIHGDLPAEFQRQFEINEALIAPLLVENNCIGLLVVDNKFNKRPIDSLDEEILSTFANLSAMALVQDRKRHLEQTRLEIAETFREVSRILSSSLEIDELLDSILSQIARVLPFDTASIQWLNEEKNGLQILRSRGFKDEKSINTLCFSLDGNYPNVDVFKGQEIRKFVDIQEIYGHFSDPYYDVQQIHGWLGVPLIIEGRSMGVITLDSHTSGIYTEDHDAIALAFAGQAAIAIENARLFERLEIENVLRTEESQALQNVGISLTETIELNAVLDRVMQAALKSVQGDECSILFFDDAKDEFTPDALMSSGLGQPLQPYRTRVRPTDGLAYKIIKEKTFVVISDTELDSRISKVAIEKGRRAMIGVPLISHEGSVGVLWVNWKAARQLSDREANILTALASQATVAIQGAKRYAEIQEYARLREGLLKAGQEIVALKEPEVVLTSIVENIRMALNCDVVTLYTYNAENKMLDFPAYVSGTLKNPEGIRMLGRVSSESVVGKILEMREAHFADDTIHDSLMNFRGKDRPKNLRSFVEREGIRSSASIPLRVGDEILGIMFANYRNPNPFTRQEIDVIKLFSNIMAIAIHNAKQYNALRETKDKLLSAGTIAWMGLFGSEWSHTVAQKTYSVRAYAQSIKEIASDHDPKITQMLDQIEMIAQEIQSVPLAISTPSQAETGKPLLIDRFLEDEVKSLCKASKQINLNFHLDCKKIYVRTDKSLLKMALQKLIDNSIRHMPLDGNLLIESSLRDESVVITLQDTGNGIPEEHKLLFGLRRIPKKQGESGTGMGAMLARFILQKYGGNLRLVWSEKDKGTNIEISLPVCNEPENALPNN